MSMTTSTPPRRKRHHVLVIVAALVALGGCGTSSTPSASTTTASTTAAPVTAAPVTTTASGPAPHSQLLPDLALPPGSTSVVIPDRTFEDWTVPASWGSQSKILDSIRSQLPLSKPYDGLPWCNESVANTKTGGLEWTWDDGKNYIIVTVQDQKVNIARDADDPTWPGCAAPAHSALANVDMPTGSQLDTNSKPGLEVWTVLLTDAETVAWLQQRLPVYGDYQGLKWCQDAGIGEGYTEWQWGDSRDWFTVHIYGQTVTFKRGPDMYGCAK
jgi:uncharacterized protein YceK